MFWSHFEGTGFMLLESVLMVSPHIYEEDLYNREDGFSLSILTQEISPQAPMLAWKDMIKIGLNPLASDDWSYGEDEYDILLILTPTHSRFMD